jgi:hypothetical protein
MYRNNVKKILTEEGIRINTLVEETGFSNSLISRIVNLKTNSTPVTQNRITIGINKLVGQKKYQVLDIFPDYQII